MVKVLLNLQKTEQGFIKNKKALGSVNRTSKNGQ